MSRNLDDNMDITERDTFDVDLIENSKNDRILEIIEMENTYWFKQIGMYPINLSEMNLFIIQMDLLKIFKDFNSDNIFKYGAKRLDALYIILKKINIETIRFCEHIVYNFFIKEFSYLFNLNVIINSSFQNPKLVDIFLEEFYINVGEYMVHFLITLQKIGRKIMANEEIYIDLLTEFTNGLVRYCSKILNSEYYWEITEKIGIFIGKKIFYARKSVFETIVRNIIEYTNNIIHPIFITIKILVSKFLDKRVSDDDVYKSVSESINIEELHNSPSDAIDEFNYLIMNSSPYNINKEEPTPLSKYNNFLYSAEHKKNSRKYASNFNIEKWHNNMREKSGIKTTSFIGISFID